MTERTPTLLLTASDLAALSAVCVQSWHGVGNVARAVAAESKMKAVRIGETKRRSFSAFYPGSEQPDVDERPMDDPSRVIVRLEAQRTQSSAPQTA